MVITNYINNHSNKYERYPEIETSLLARSIIRTDTTQSADDKIILATSEDYLQVLVFLRE